MSSDSGSSRTLGAVLIGIGLWVYLVREGHVHGLPLLVILGVAFVVGYFVRRAPGLLVPGCILLGVGLGRMLDAGLGRFGDPERLGLGLGFVAIYAIQKAYQGRAHWWPLIPGAVILLSASRYTEGLSRFLIDHWPLALVVVGAVILLVPVLGRRSS